MNRVSQRKPPARRRMSETDWMRRSIRMEKILIVREIQSFLLTRVLRVQRGFGEVNGESSLYYSDAVSEGSMNRLVIWVRRV
jgi:hypothetical protein